LPFVTPVYKRDLVIENYFGGYLKHPYISFYTGRGCKSRCTFCLWPQTIGGHRYRTRSVGHVIEELSWAQKAFPQVKEFFFDDDTLTDNLPRVEALARRSATVVKETVLRVGDLELDLVSRTVNRGGRAVELLPREFQVLEYLVRNEGHVVPRAMLLEHVWDLHFDPTTNIIDVYVGRVRRKVDSEQAYPLIHTIRGVGFCVRAPR